MLWVGEKPVLVFWGVDIATEQEINQMAAVAKNFLKLTMPEKLMLSGRRAHDVSKKAEDLMRNVLSDDAIKSRLSWYPVERTTPIALDFGWLGHPGVLTSVYQAPPHRLHLQMSPARAIQSQLLFLQGCSMCLHYSVMFP